jgi:uncharacterized protein (TIGR02646 family)
MPLTYTLHEQANITTVLAKPGNIWDDELIVEVKNKIKDYYTNNDLSQCCYCGTVFQGIHRMNIDIEHILPKSKYRPLTFEPINLNIACKKCNLTSKGQKIDFLHDPVAMGTDYYNSSHYKFIHPNLDTYTDHLKIITSRNGNTILHKYIVQNEQKGRYTYNYFHLEDFEINYINVAQGIKEKSFISEKISALVRRQLLILLSRI